MLVLPQVVAVARSACGIDASASEGPEISRGVGQGDGNHSSAGNAAWGKLCPECHTYQTAARKPPSSNIAGGSQSLSSINTGLVRRIRTAHPCPFARRVPAEVIEDVVNSGRSVTVATEEPGISGSVNPICGRPYVSRENCCCSRLQR